MGQEALDASEERRRISVLKEVRKRKIKGLENLSKLLWSPCPSPYCAVMKLAEVSLGKGRVLKPRVGKVWLHPCNPQPADKTELSLLEWKDAVTKPLVISCLYKPPH